MVSRKTFFQLWQSNKERRDLLRTANQRRLLPAQVKRLLTDGSIRAALQDTRMASLLPPVGSDVFRRFTLDSLVEIQRRRDAEEEGRQTKKTKKKNNKQEPTSDLEAGKPLPFFYGDPPTELLSSQLEELDPFYQSQKTFLVLGKGNVIHRFNAGSSCYLLSPFNPLRTIAINILLHSLFHVFILVTILTNCVLMTIRDPPAWTGTAELVFTAVYTLEAVLKIVSKGFCVGKFSFLRDPWNWLDVMVIITGYVMVFVDFGKLSVLSSVPRVLKIIPVIPGLKTTVGALVQSVKGLAGVVVLLAFGLSFFALIGQRLLMGSLNRKCVMWPAHNRTEFDYNEYINNPDNQYFLPGSLDALLCGNTSDAGMCPDGFMCLRTRTNPNYGFTSFDSIGWSLLSLVRLMTQDFWDNLVMMTLRAAGKGYLTFFVVVVFPGCFCLLSLAMAAVAMASIEQEGVGVAKLRQREEELSRILEALKRSEEEEQEASRAAPSPGAMTSPGTDGPDEEWWACSPCWLAGARFLLKWNCCGCWRRLKQWLHCVVSNPFFDLGIIVCLIVNSVFMAMEHFPMTERFERVLTSVYLAFTVIFMAEMVVKLVAMDPYEYFQVGWNIFDSILVIISLMNLIIDDRFRWLTVMRILRLARWWPALRVLLKVIWTSVRTLGNQTLVLLIVVFVFAVVGVQLFGQDYNDHVCLISVDCRLPRWHMYDFFHAFLIVFRVLCGEFIETMWDCMEVSGQTTCLVFFMMLMVIGNLLVLNLFLGLLLNLISCDNLMALEEKETNNFQIALSRIHRALWALLGKETLMDPHHPEFEGQAVNRKQYLALPLVTTDQLLSEVKALGGNHDNLTGDNRNTTEVTKTLENQEENERHPDVQQNHEDKDQRADGPEDCCSDKCYRCCPFLDIDMSRGGGRVWSNFRRVCFSIVQHKNFEIFIIIIIMLSSIALVFEDVHLQQLGLLKTVLQRADQVFTFIFLLEMILKWISFGLKRYFSDAWCWIDFLILHVSLVSLVADWFGFSELGLFWTLRALVPLRILSRFPELRVVVQVVVRSVPSMVNVLLVFLLVWLVFSILGVNLFAGKFNYCFNDTSEEFLSSVTNKTECLDLIHQNFTETRWTAAKFNYDSVMNGYLLLFRLAAEGSWMDSVYSAVDATWVYSQPIYEFNPLMNLYFIGFFIISSFFTFSLFIFIIINNLQRDKFEGRPVLMTEQQLKYFRVLKERLMKPQKPVPRPQNRFQARVFDLVTNQWFLVFVVALISLYLVTQMVETDQQSEEMEVILSWFHFVFTVLFFIEFIVKVVALRWHFFTDGWNILDFVAITATIVGMFISDLLKRFLFPFSLFLVLRGVHILRILVWARGIRKLLLAFMMSLPALFNISVLLFVIMFTYTIFGMFHFAYVKKAAMFGDMFNFETFGSSLICMFMVTTTSSWVHLLYPMMDSPPDCDPNIKNPGSTVTGNCVNPAVGIAFFFTYICLSFLLVLHLFIAVILETLCSEDTEPLSDKDLQMFYGTWRKFDPTASQFLQYSELSDFCNALKDPLRIPKPKAIKLIHMDPPPVPGDKVHYTDVLLAVTTQVSGDSGKMNLYKARMEEMFMAKPSKVSGEPISSLQRKQEDVAATVIQRAFRRHVLQHKDRKETTVQPLDGGVL